jgi:exosortase K
MTKAGALAAAIVIAWALKQHYANAQADDLWWILAPTATLVGVVTDVPFTWQPGEGYFSRERLFLIEKSCAGINFMLAAFAVLMLTLFHRVSTGRSALGVLGASLVGSYVAAVATNTIRIVIALWLAAQSLPLSAFSAAAVHRAEGIVVYFGGLALLYDVAQRLDRGTRGADWKRFAVPLATYYAVTLGIPLANGAARSGAIFVEHAFVVLIVPPIVLLAFRAMVATTRPQAD